MYVTTDSLGRSEIHDGNLTSDLPPSILTTLRPRIEARKKEVQASYMRSQTTKDIPPSTKASINFLRKVEQGSEGEVKEFQRLINMAKNGNSTAMTQYVELCAAAYLLRVMGHPLFM